MVYDVYMGRTKTSSNTEKCRECRNVAARSAKRLRTEVLKDGSIATVETEMHQGHPRHLISRFVEDECVWGQVFWGDRADACRDNVLAEMRLDPQRFKRWWL